MDTVLTVSKVEAPQWSELAFLGVGGFYRIGNDWYRVLEKVLNETCDMYEVILVPLQDYEKTCQLAKTA